MPAYSSSLVRFRLSPVSIYCFNTVQGERFDLFQYFFFVQLHFFSSIEQCFCFESILREMLKRLWKNQFSSHSRFLHLWHDFAHQWCCMNVIGGIANVIRYQYEKKTFGVHTLNCLNSILSFLNKFSTIIPLEVRNRRRI